MSAAGTAALKDPDTPDSHKLRLYILQRLQLMLNQADKHTELAQAAYKRYFDRNVRFAQSFVAEQAMYVNLPPTYVQTKAEKGVHF